MHKYNVFLLENLRGLILSMSKLLIAKQGKERNNVRETLKRIFSY